MSEKKQKPFVVHVHIEMDTDSAVRSGIRREHLPAAQQIVAEMMADFEAMALIYEDRLENLASDAVAEA